MKLFSILTDFRLFEIFMGGTFRLFKILRKKKSQKKHTQKSSRKRPVYGVFLSSAAFTLHELPFSEPIRALVTHRDHNQPIAVPLLAWR